MYNDKIIWIATLAEIMQTSETTLRIEAQEKLQRDSLWYLGLIITKDGEIKDDVEHMKSGIVKVKTCY